jgi:hypothetical protein
MIPKDSTIDEIKGRSLNRTLLRVPIAHDLTCDSSTRIYVERSSNYIQPRRINKGRKGCHHLLNCLYLTLG